MYRVFKKDLHIKNVIKNYSKKVTEVDFVVFEK